MPDCFAGLKADLLNPEEVGDAISDIRNYLTGKFQTGGVGVDDPLAVLLDKDVGQTLADFKAYLDKILIPKAQPLSGSSKSLLAKERSRVSDLLRLRAYLEKSDLDPDFWDMDEYEYLSKRFSNIKVWGKGYPVDYEEVWAAFDTHVTNNAAGIPNNPVVLPTSVEVPMAGSSDVMEIDLAQLQQALDTLENSKGIMVKQPLAKVGNPLQYSDYHAIAKPYPGKTKEGYIQWLKDEIAKLDPGGVPGVPAAPTPAGPVFLPVGQHPTSLPFHVPELGGKWTSQDAYDYLFEVFTEAGADKNEWLSELNALGDVAHKFLAESHANGGGFEFKQWVNSIWGQSVKQAATPNPSALGIPVGKGGHLLKVDFGQPVPNFSWVNGSTYLADVEKHAILDALFPGDPDLVKAIFAHTGDGDIADKLIKAHVNAWKTDFTELLDKVTAKPPVGPKFIDEIVPGVNYKIPPSVQEKLDNFESIPDILAGMDPDDMIDYMHQIGLPQPDTGGAKVLQNYKLVEAHMQHKVEQLEDLIKAYYKDPASIPHAPLVLEPPVPPGTLPHSPPSGWPTAVSTDSWQLKYLDLYLENTHHIDADTILNKLTKQQKITAVQAHIDGGTDSAMKDLWDVFVDNYGNGNPLPPSVAPDPWAHLPHNVPFPNIVDKGKAMADQMREMAKAAGYKDGPLGLKAMGHQARTQWVKAWYNGDYLKAGQLEQNALHKLGKSIDLPSTHPGAPGNWSGPVLHKPYIDGQPPAGIGNLANSMDYPTSTKYNGDLFLDTHDSGIVDQYIVDMKADHLAQWLQGYERNSLARAHFEGDQYNVDRLMRTAEARMNNGQDPFGPVLPQNPAAAHVTPGKPTNPVSPTAPSTPPKDRTWKPTGITLKQGTHPVMVLEDADTGVKWVFKRMPEQFRMDTEHAANEISRLLGFKVPETENAVMYEGKKWLIQRFMENDGNLGGMISPSSTKLTDEQLTQLVQHHVLDWFLDNDDAHVENFLRIEGDLVGIDKGRAFKNVGRSRLGLDYLDQQAHVAVGDVYRLIQQGVIGREQADKLYFAALKQARAMRRVDRKKLRELIMDGLKHRTDYSSTIANNADELADLMLKRLDGLEDDFDKLWGEVYGRAGWDLPEPPKGVGGVMDGGEFTGHSQELLDRVAQTGSHGTTTFWHSADIENGTELLWRELYEGKPVLRIELKTRADGDKKMLDWLGKQGVTTPVKPDIYDLPGNDVGTGGFYHQIIEGVKTINHHAGDGAYNASRVQKMLEAVGKARTQRAELPSVFDFKAVRGATPNIEAFVSDNMPGPISKAKSDVKLLWQQAKGDPDVFEHLVTEYRDMLDYYIDIATKAEKAMTDGVQVPGGKNIARYVPKEYNPTPSAVAPPTPAYSVETLNDWRVPIGNDFDFETGMTHEHAGDPTRLVGRHQAYRIQIAPGIEADYVPWKGGLSDEQSIGVQGILRARFSDFDGDASALDTWKKFLEDVGFEMTPAEETDLELLYWRQYANAFRERETFTDSGWSGGWGGSKNPDSAQAAKENAMADLVKAEIDKVRGMTLSPEDEIDALKTALEGLYKREDMDAFDWRPQFRHQMPTASDLPTGRPSWRRFDMTPDVLNDTIRGKLPTSGLTGPRAVANVARSGGMFSQNERLRLLQLHIDTMSAGTDMDRGGSNYVFTRLDGKEHDVFYTPDALARISTISDHTDIYGAPGIRNRTSPWDPKAWKKHTAGNNETDFKDMMSVMDDIEVLVFPSAAERDAAVKFYKDHGVTEIRGLKVEDRFVTSGQRDTAVARALANWRKLNGLA